MKLTSNLTFDNVIKQYEDKYNRKYYGPRRDLLRTGCEKGYDISLYAYPDYDFTQLQLIYDGFEEGLNVKLYAKAAHESNPIVLRTKSWCITTARCVVTLLASV